MMGYGYNITIDDRWRIVMYIRALQRSQNAALADASPEEQAQLDKTKNAARRPWYAGICTSIVPDQYSLQRTKLMRVVRRRDPVDRTMSLAVHGSYRNQFQP